MRGLIRYSACLCLLVLIGCNAPLSAPTGSSTPGATATLTGPLINESEISTSTPTWISPTPISTLSPVPASSTPNPTIDVSSPQVTSSEQTPAEINPITSSNASDLIQVKEMHFDPWEQITSLTWSPDNLRLAVSAGGTIYLIDVRDWRVAGALRVGVFHYDMEFSPDGVWLASGGRDGYLRAWFLPPSLDNFESNSQPDIELQAHRKGVNSVEFSPQGGLLATGGNDAVARFWDLQTGENLGTMIGGTFAVASISFSPDGEILAVVNGDTIRLREVGSERILGTFLAENPLFTVDYSPDGRLLAAGDNENHVMIWETESAYRTGQESYPQPIHLLRHEGQLGNYRALIWRVVFSPHGQLLASAGGDATVRLWNVADGSLLRTLTGHDNGVTCVGFSHDGSVLASGGLDGVLRVWGIAR